MQKKINLALILGIVITVFLMSVFSIPSISAAENLNADNITLVTPGASGILVGVNATVNCSYAAGYVAENYSTAWFYVNSVALTANTSIVVMASSVQNVTDRSFNTTIDSTKLEDGNDYRVTCEIWNGSNRFNNTRTGITIDNGVPTAPSSMYPSGSVTNRSFTFGGTVAGADTTACTLYFNGTNPGSSSYSMTHSGNTCTYAISSIPEQSYRWYITASDGSNTTQAASTTTTRVDVGSSTAKIPALLEEPGVSSAGGATLSITPVERARTALTTKIGGLPIWLIIAAVVGIVAIVLIKRK